MSIHERLTKTFHFIVKLNTGLNHSKNHCRDDNKILIVLVNLAQSNIYSQKCLKMFIYGPIFKIKCSTEAGTLLNTPRQGLELNISAKISQNRIL